MPLNEKPRPNRSIGEHSDHYAKTFNIYAILIEILFKRNHICVIAEKLCTYCFINRQFIKGVCIYTEIALFKIVDGTKTIQVRRTRHAGHSWRSRDELIRDVLLWTPTHGRAKAGRPARTYIQQLCEDTGCCPEDLPRAMNDREEWRERVRDIRATSAIWWWWRLWTVHWSYLCRLYCSISLTGQETTSLLSIEGCFSEHSYDTLRSLYLNHTQTCTGILLFYR